VAEYSRADAANRERECARLKNGEVGVVSGIFPCCRARSVRSDSSMGKSRAGSEFLCGDMCRAYPASLTRFCADLVSL